MTLQRQLIGESLLGLTALESESITIMAINMEKTGRHSAGAMTEKLHSYL